MRTGLAVLLVLASACRRAPVDPKPDGSVPAPSMPLLAPSDEDRARAVDALLGTYAADLAEVADRVEALGTRGAPDADGAPPHFARVPSPARGTRLAARPEVVEVVAPLHPGLTLVIAPLRGEMASEGEQVNLGDGMPRGRDLLVPMCPSFHDDDARAVDVTLRRGALLLVATVRAAKPLCPGGPDRDRRDAQIDAAKAYFAPAEARLLAYLDDVGRACDAPDGALPDPGELPGLGRPRSAHAACMRGNSGTWRSWATPAEPPGEPGERRRVGHYLPRAARFFAAKDAPSGTREVRLYGMIDGDVEVDVTMAFPKSPTPRR